MNTLKSVLLSALFTIAVGLDAYGQGWNEVPTSNLPGRNQLLGIAAAGPNEAFAVGYSGSDAVRSTLVVHIVNGQAHIMPTPNNSGFAINELYAVWSMGPNNVWAVGRLLNPSSLLTATLIMHFDGTSWTIVPSPNPDTGSNELLAITGTSSTNIYAGGFHSSSAGNAVAQNLLLHFNGNGWSVVTNFPNLAGSGVNNEIKGLSASASNNVWAVGFTGNTHTNYEPFAFRFDGNSWTMTKIVPHSSGAVGSFFSSVAANSPNDVWAVGQSNADSVLSNIQHFNGTSWSQFFWRKLDPNQPINEVPLLSVSCGSVGTCYAVGSIQGAALILKWDPTQEIWLQVQAALLANPPSDLFGVSLFPGGSAFTAGLQFQFDSSGTSGQYDNLVEQNKNP